MNEVQSIDLYIEWLSYFIHAWEIANTMDGYIHTLKLPKRFIRVKIFFAILQITSLNAAFRILWYAITRKVDFPF